MNIHERQSQNKRRQHIATQIAAGICATKYPRTINDNEAQVIAAEAYTVADALIKEGKNWDSDKET